MSRTRAEAYAKHLASLDEKGRNSKFFLKGIRQLGKLFDFDASEPYDYAGFGQILRELDKSFDISTKVAELAPQCDELFLHCVWRGVTLNCSDEKTAFRQVLSETGPCCLFNSRKISSSTYGVNSGLILHVNTSMADFFYTTEPFIGFRAQFLNPDARVDQSVGRIAALIPSGTETLAKIDASVLKTDLDVEQYPMAKRRCRFDDDSNVKYKIRPYRRSNCVRSYRLESILTLCQCIPMYMDDLITNKTKSKICKLEHLPCLSRYADKWLTPLFTSVKQPGVETEFENGLACLDCLPPCVATKFSVSTTRLPLINLRQLAPRASADSGRLRNITKMNDLVVLKIFYGRRDYFMYRQYISKNWFELLSDLGGLSSVFIGFSAVSIAEVVYFIVRTFNLSIKNGNRNEALKSRAKNFRFYR